jgi:hypothetical protein
MWMWESGCGFALPGGSAVSVVGQIAARITKATLVRLPISCSAQRRYIRSKDRRLYTSEWEMARIAILAARFWGSDRWWAIFLRPFSYAVLLAPPATRAAGALPGEDARAGGAGDEQVPPIRRFGRGGETCDHTVRVHGQAYGSIRQLA